MRGEKVGDAELLRRRMGFDDGRLMELCHTLKEAKVPLEDWRKHYSPERPDYCPERPNSALGYRPPAPASIPPVDQRSVLN